MKNIINHLENSAQNAIGSRILQVIAGLVVVYRFFTEIRFAEFLFEVNKNSLIYSPLILYGCLGIWLIGGLALILGSYTRIATIGVLIAYFCLENVTITSDGGDNVLRIVLLYMVFFHDLVTSSTKIKPGVRVFIHNIAVKMTIFQIIVLYLVSGTLKLQGDVWFNGTALYYITGVEQFSTNIVWLKSLFSNPIVTTLATYSSVVYQLGFPFMLSNRYHLVWVFMGIGFHLGIFLVMGLTTFSLIMIGLILFTVRDSEWDTIFKFFQNRVLPRFVRQSTVPIPTP
jgi:hypothetical protein